MGLLYLLVLLSISISLYLAFYLYWINQRLRAEIAALRQEVESMKPNDGNVRVGRPKTMWD